MTYLAPSCSAWVAPSRARPLAWCPSGEEGCKGRRVLAGSLVPGLGSAADGPMLLASPTGLLGEWPMLRGQSVHPGALLGSSAVCSVHWRNSRSGLLGCCCGSHGPWGTEWLCLALPEVEGVQETWLGLELGFEGWIGVSQAERQWGRVQRREGWTWMVTVGCWVVMGGRVPEGSAPTGAQSAEGKRAPHPRPPPRPRPVDSPGPAGRPGPAELSGLV